jgi:phosphate/sulfate permease
MALVKCRECGDQVSDQAHSCPHCGIPMPVVQGNNDHTSDAEDSYELESSELAPGKVGVEKKGGILNGIIVGLLCGIIGATIWAGVTYFTGYEISWVAWGIGGLVGFGFTFASRRSGALYGFIASIITIFSILGGKFAYTDLIIGEEMGSKTDFIEYSQSEFLDELIISYLSDEIIAELESSGETVEWPPDVDPEAATEEADYPRNIWAQANTRWNEMSTEDQHLYRDDIAEIYTKALSEEYFKSYKETYLAMFGLLDLLFLGLGVITSFQIAARGRKKKN